MRKLVMGAVIMLTLTAGTNVSQAAPYSSPPPDFVITNLAVVAGSTNIVTGAKTIAKIVVDVADNCHRANAYMPYVSVDVYAAKGGKALASVGNEVSLAPGAVGHLEITLKNLVDTPLPTTSYLYAQVDPENKIHEVVETNNSWSLNPIQGPFPQPGGYCNVANSNAGRPH